MFVRPWAQVAAGLIVLLIVAGCQSPNTGVPEKSGDAANADRSATANLTVMVNDLGTERMDVVYAGASGNANNYARLLHAFLIATNDRAQLVPGIASSWSLSSDGRKWTFTIRKGVRFHDGADLTPADIAWSLEHSIGPEAFNWTSVSQLATASRNMVKIEVAGPDTVVLTTKEPDLGIPTLLSEASSQWVPVLPKRSALNDERQALAFDQAPIGAGPMKLVGHVPGASMKFERFDDYYYQPKNGFSEDRRVPFRTLLLNAVKEEATRVSALRSGEADIVVTSAGSRPQVEAGGGHIVYAQEGATLEARLYGCGDKKYACGDKRVRQALDYAIDRKLIQSTLGGGPDAFKIRGWSGVSPSSEGYTPQVDPRPFDPAKARQLLADAGYPGGARFGKLLVYTFPSSDVPFQVESAQLAAATWKKELGLDVEVKVIDVATHDSMLAAKQLDGQIVWRSGAPKADPSSQVVVFFGDPKSKNMMLKDDQALIQALRNAVVTVDPAKRVEALKNVYVRLWDESYVIQSGYLNVAWGIGPRITAWKPYPLTFWPSALYTLTLK